MQVNLNCNCPKPQFGMAMQLDANTMKVIKSRIVSIKEAEQLAKIVERQKANKSVDISLYGYDSGVLEASIYPVKVDDKFFNKRCTENMFSRYFRSPVSFIKKVAHIADKKAAEIAKRDEIEKAIDDKISY